MRSMKSDVVVVGGGVVGLSVALELRRRGATVTVVERERLGHGCSFGNAGWLTPSLCVPLPAPGLIWKSFQWLFDPESPLYIQPRFDAGLARWIAGFLIATRKSTFERGAEAMVALCRQSVDAWERLAKEHPENDFGFARRGLVSIFESKEAFEKAREGADLVAKFGAPYELWTADEVREREPAVIGAQVGAYFFPQDAQCEPYPAVRALVAEVERAGVTLREDTEVVSIETQDGSVRRLTTTRGDLRPEHVVLATGAWSQAIGRAIDLRIPILGAKGYSLVLPKLDPHPTRSLNLAERKVAINPHRDGLRIAGTLELVDNDYTINQRRVNAILRGAKGMLALPEPIEIKALWRGLRPCTPDGMPLLGRARGRKNLWLATGHQMTGLKTAPASGVLLAQLMAGETTTLDPEPFRADRY
jgi:D-amino-acid dehydrogenase